MPKTPTLGTRRPTGTSRSADEPPRNDRHLRAAAADEVLDVEGVGLPLRPTRRRSTRIVLWVGGPIVVLAGFAALFIPPTRSYLNQKRQYTENLRKLEAVQAANGRLENQIAALETDAEVERIARARYNLVRDGDQIIAVLPAPTPNQLPNEWPYTLLQDIVTIRLQHPETMPGAAPSTVATTATTTAALTADETAPSTPETTTAP
jgi:cell division protein FtsB